MIEYGSGDLLNAGTEALINTVNCVGVMGKGIALQFKRRYPDMFKQYEAACRHGEVTIGRMFVYDTEPLHGPRLVINFPTKKHWRAPSQLAYIDSGLADLIRVIDDNNITSIAIPPLGAGNGGLDWADVEPRIVAAFASRPDVRVVLYAPAGGVRQIAAPAAIRMTWGRAIMLEAVRRYMIRRGALEPWEDAAGASHLEIQKLMYFADVAEPSLNLSFVPGRYGPYSEKVRHLLQGMEGAYTTGFGDGSGRVLDHVPIAPTDRGSQELDAFLHADTAAAQHVSRTVDAVLEVIAGFEGPYGVELLASTHWVAARENQTDAVSAANAVRTWTQRKGRIYDDSRVGIALRHLQDSAAV
ncbi:MAG: macro domain-containing protein [Mycobacterium sp.]